MARDLKGSNLQSEFFCEVETQNMTDFFLGFSFFPEIIFCLSLIFLPREKKKNYENSILKNTLDFVLPKKKKRSMLGKYEQCFGAQGQYMLLKYSYPAFLQGEAREITISCDLFLNATSSSYFLSTFYIIFK